MCSVSPYCFVFIPFNLFIFAFFVSFLLEYKSKGYWLDVNNCRKFFDEYAKEKGFDPLDAENWYEVRSVDLGEKKVAFLFPLLFLLYLSWSFAFRFLRNSLLLSL